MADEWVPPRTLQWDFENKCPMTDKKHTTSNLNQFQLNDCIEDTIGWRESTPQQIYCGRYGHTEDSGVCCILCGAIRE